METYGELDGSIVYQLRHQLRPGCTVPDGHAAGTADGAAPPDPRRFHPQAAFLYAQPIDFPQVPSTDFLFR